MLNRCSKSLFYATPAGCGISQCGVKYLNAMGWIKNLPPTFHAAYIRAKVLLRIFVLVSVVKSVFLESDE